MPCVRSLSGSFLGRLIARMTKQRFVRRRVWETVRFTAQRGLKKEGEGAGERQRSTRDGRFRKGTRICVGIGVWDECMGDLPLHISGEFATHSSQLRNSSTSLQLRLLRGSKGKTRGIKMEDEIAREYKEVERTSRGRSDMSMTDRRKEQKSRTSGSGLIPEVLVPRRGGRAGGE
eukprot:3050819-Pleurochrysis_carterae.AAC.1